MENKLRQADSKLSSMAFLKVLKSKISTTGKKLSKKRQDRISKKEYRGPSMYPNNLRKA